MAPAHRLRRYLIAAFVGLAFLSVACGGKGAGTAAPAQEASEQEVEEPAAVAEEEPAGTAQGANEQKPEEPAAVAEEPAAEVPVSEAAPAKSEANAGKPPAGSENE